MSKMLRWLLYARNVASSLLRCNCCCWCKDYGVAATNEFTAVADVVRISGNHQQMMKPTRFRPPDAQALRHPWLGDLAARDAPPSPLQQATAPPRNQFKGMPRLSESYEFVVSPVPAGGARAEAAAAVGGSDSLGSQPYHQVK